MNESIHPAAAQASWARWIPALSAVRLAQPGWIRADIVAGITLAAYLLPAAIGDASLAGLPAEAGLYACLFSGLVFWIFCSSRHTAITVTSAISLLTGSSLGVIAFHYTPRFRSLAVGAAARAALVALIAWRGGAGGVVPFMSGGVRRAH